MSYFVTKDAANATLATVKASILHLPIPTVKRPDDNFKNRDNELTDEYYIVWPNGFHVPVAQLQLAIKYDGWWVPRLLLEYDAWLAHKPAMDGTEEGIHWKD